MKKGIFLTFDFVIEDLKKYYSYTSPKNAYREIGKYLLENRFEKTKDSDYISYNLSKTKALRLLKNFSKNNKWFGMCLQKLSITPIEDIWELSNIFKDKVDLEYKQQKEKEYTKIISNKKERSYLIKRLEKKKEIIQNIKVKEKNIAKDKNIEL